MLRIIKQINAICEFIVRELPDTYERETVCNIGFEPVEGKDIVRINKKSLLQIIEENKRIIEEYEKPYKESGEKKYNILKNKIRALNEEITPENRYHTELLLQFIEEMEK